MSLQVWLPLNGNLNNQGLSDVTFTNEGNISVDTSGKIGSCYSRATKQTSGRIISNSKVLFDKSLSICCWAYVSDCVGDTANGLVTIHSHEHNSNVGINVKQYSTTDYRICCNTGTGSGRTFHEYYGTTNIKNIWSHLTLTYNNVSKILKLYVNGKCEYTLNNYTNYAISDNIILFDWSTTYNYPSYRPACKLNDVRIYDHCLSSKEIKEISKGLICHYKLDNNGFGGENLILQSHRVVSGANASGITSAYMDDGSLKIVSTPGNSGWRSCGFSKDSNSNVGNKLSIGDTYTISLDVKIEEGNSLPSLFINNGNPYRALQPVNGRIITNNWFRAYYTNTWYEPGTSYGNISIHLNFSGITGTFYFKNFKLEKGSKPTQWCPSPLDDNTLGLDSTTESDCSGYSYNGTISESLTYVPSSPRYDGCYYFNSASKRITLPTINMSGFSNSFSISWWGKAPSYSDTGLMYWGFSDGNRLNYYAGLYCNTGDGGGNPYYKPNTTTTISIPSVNTWHHFVMVGDGSSNKLYMDGELYGIAKTYVGITGSTIVINGWDSSTSYKTNGYISDFRIYSTVLSASDIKELYNTPASLDKNGNIYAYEFKEE